MGERARGAVLYAAAGLVLAGGGVWWVRAAPHAQVDPEIEQWRRSAEQLLPYIEQQENADTLALAAGADQTVRAEVDDGSYLVSVVCVGGAESRMRISLSDGGDSGHGLDCAGDQTPYNFNVAVSGGLRMNLSVGEAGSVVFRYSILRTEN